MYPQLDVEEPLVRLREDFCNISSPGVVYELSLLDHNWEPKASSCLTIEELEVLHFFIGRMIKLRKNDPRRQGAV